MLRDAQQTIDLNFSCTVRRIDILCEMSVAIPMIEDARLMASMITLLKKSDSVESSSEALTSKHLVPSRSNV